MVSTSILICCLISFCNDSPKSSAVLLTSRMAAVPMSESNVASQGCGAPSASSEDLVSHVDGVDIDCENKEDDSQRTEDSQGKVLDGQLAVPTAVKGDDAGKSDCENKEDDSQRTEDSPGKVLDGQLVVPTAVKGDDAGKSDCENKEDDSQRTEDSQGKVLDGQLAVPTAVKGDDAGKSDCENKEDDSQRTEDSPGKVLDGQLVVPTAVKGDDAGKSDCENKEDDSQRTEDSPGKVLDGQLVVPTAVKGDDAGKSDCENKEDDSQRTEDSLGKVLDGQLLVPTAVKGDDAGKSDARKSPTPAADTAAAIEPLEDNTGDANAVSNPDNTNEGAIPHQDSVGEDMVTPGQSGGEPLQAGAVAMASARTSVDGQSGSESGSAELSESLEAVALLKPEDANNPEDPSTSQDHHGSLQSDTLASGHKDTSLCQETGSNTVDLVPKKKEGGEGKEKEDGGVSSSQSSCPDSTTSTAQIFDQRDDSVEQSDNSPDDSPMVDSQETVLLTGAELEEPVDGQEASDNASNDDSPSDNPVSYSKESLPSKGAESPMEDKEASSDILEDAGSTGSAHSDHSSDAEEHFEDNNSGVRCLDGSPTDNPVSYSKESLPSKGAESPMEVKEGSSDIPEDAGSLDSADSDRFFDTKEYLEDNNSGDKHPDDDFDSDGDENTAAASVTVVSAEEVYADVVAVPTTTGRPSKRKRKQLAKQEKKKKGKASITVHKPGVF